MHRLGTEMPAYTSIDIDVINPGLAPATGTPEPGGRTTRELVKILRGIEGLSAIGADLVEVSFASGGAAETTAFTAAQIVYAVLTSMVRKGFVEQAKTRREAKYKVKDEL